MNHVNCLSPIIIVNPQINQSVVRFTHIVIDGRLKRITDEMRYLLLEGESPSKVLGIPYAKNLSRENYKNLSDNEFLGVYSRLEDYLDHSFMLHEDTGETMMCYQYVKCGHCDVCNSSKLSSLIQRCAFQSELFDDTTCNFVTLTFNNSHLPDLAGAKRLFVNFKKRLKQNVDSVYFISRHSETKYSDKLKFLAVFETGKMNRLHIHAIIFGLPYFSDISSEHSFYLNKLIQFCWRQPCRSLLNRRFYMGFYEYIRKYPLYTDLPAGYDEMSYGYVNVDKSKSVGATVKYITKYLFKNFSDNEKFLFKSSSVNLGYDFVLKFRDIIKDHHCIEYVSRHDNQVKKVRLSSYFVNKLFPPDSVTFPLDFRRAFYNCYLGALEISNFKYSDINCKPLRKFGLFIKTQLEDRYPFMFSVFESVSEPFKKSFLDGFHFGVKNEIHDNVMKYLVSLYNIIEDNYDLLSKYDFSYKQFLIRSQERAAYFSKFLDDNSLSYGQLVDIAAQFRKDIKYNQSIQTI